VLPLPSPGDPQYEETPYHRYGHTAVAWGDRAYIFGGRNDKNGACSILYCFDPVTKTWSRPSVSGETPGARDGHSSCVINHKMYVFGGYEEGAQRFSNDIYALSFYTMTWSLVKVKSGKPARWRDFHSATGIGDKMYIFGGRSDRAGPQHTNNEMYCSKIQVFDTVHNVWYEPQVTGTVPCGRRSHSAFVYKGELYILSGYNGIYDLHFDDMYKFNPAEYRWSVVMTKGRGPCARRRQCCCLVQDRLYVFGGTRPCQNDSDEAEFNLIDLADLHVLDFVPTLKTLSMLAVLDAALDLSCLPHDLRSEILAMTTNSNISRTVNTSG
jgi:N-acetylneuraminic acid mutarotase